MPSSSFMASSPSPTRAALPTTLDEAASLLNKKKITKDEIDEQKLLHRAADSGEVVIINNVIYCARFRCCFIKPNGCQT